MFLSLSIHTGILQKWPTFVQSCPSYPANSSQTTCHANHDISQCLSRQGSEARAHPATGKCRDIGLRPESEQLILASASPRPGRRTDSSDLIATLAFMQVFKVTASSPGCHSNTETQESTDQRHQIGTKTLRAFTMSPTEEHDDPAWPPGTVRLEGENTTS